MLNKDEETRNENEEIENEEIENDNDNEEDGEQDTLKKILRLKRRKLCFLRKVRNLIQHLNQQIL